MELKTPISLKKEHEELHTMLKQATQLSGKTGEPAKTVAEFAEKLMLHAQTEEEVSYPTAILIGEFIKLRFN